MKKQRGYTLVEVVVALFVGVLLLTAIYVVMVSGQKSSVAIEGKIVAQQDVRAILDIMTLEIGMASYNATFSPTVWGSSAANRGIAQVSDPANPSNLLGMDVALRVQMDLNENGVLGDPDETITYIYDYDTGNERITRDTGAGAISYLGDIPGTLGRSVRVVNHTLGLPVFRYFDAGGNEIAAANVPANINLIRRIEVTLAVDTESMDPDTQQRRRMIYTSSAFPRNHAIY
jgi:prepilin-type N-terminal cleavage/methylation domain-containing protein